MIRASGTPDVDAAESEVAASPWTSGSWSWAPFPSLPSLLSGVSGVSDRLISGWARCTCGEWLDVTCTRAGGGRCTM
jgi:hypothetical protein